MHVLLAAHALLDSTGLGAQVFLKDLAGCVRGVAEDRTRPGVVVFQLVPAPLAVHVLLGSISKGVARFLMEYVPLARA